MFVISDIKREYIPILQKERPNKTKSFSIDEKSVILKVTLVLPVACIKEAKIFSK